MPYFTPGASRRFMPKYGSGYFFASTSALNTVLRAGAEYQPVARNPAVDSAAPVSRTSAEDWMDHPLSTILLSAARAAEQARTRSNRRIKKFLKIEISV